MNKTSIEWTDASWNPIHARAGKHGRVGNFCTRISPGCTHCYAAAINRRFGNGFDYTVPNLENVQFFVDEKELEAPLRRKKPAKIFVGDMFDLFHEAIPDSFIDAVVCVAAEADWHTFQFLTKRAARMQKYFKELSAERLRAAGRERPPDGKLHSWPFRNLWLGVSVEDQQRAEERIPLLLDTPAAVRWLSVEPMLEQIEMCPDSIDGMPSVNMLTGADWCDPPVPGIDWIVCGGESGPGARPFNIAWAESLLKQCRNASVPFFMKQFGAKPGIHESAITAAGVSYHHFDKASGLFIKRLDDRKGGDPEEWPEHLRVREFPTEYRSPAC